MRAIIALRFGGRARTSRSSLRPQQLLHKYSHLLHARGLNSSLSCNSGQKVRGLNITGEVQGNWQPTLASRRGISHIDTMTVTVTITTEVARSNLKPSSLHHKICAEPEQVSSAMCRRELPMPLPDSRWLVLELASNLQAGKLQKRQILTAAEHHRKLQEHQPSRHPHTKVL